MANSLTILHVVNRSLFRPPLTAVVIFENLWQENPFSRILSHSYSRICYNYSTYYRQPDLIALMLFFDSCFIAWLYSINYGLQCKLFADCSAADSSWS